MGVIFPEPEGVHLVFFSVYLLMGGGAPTRIRFILNFVRLFYMGWFLRATLLHSVIVREKRMAKRYELFVASGTLDFACLLLFVVLCCFYQKKPVFYLVFCCFI